MELGFVIYLLDLYRRITYHWFFFRYTAFALSIAARNFRARISMLDDIAAVVTEGEFSGAAMRAVCGL